MGRYIVARLIGMVPLILGITIVTFAIANLVPGSPVTQYEFQPGVRPEDIERIRRQLGLDQPLHIRYVQWLSHVLRGDLGLSLITFRPVSELILEKLPNTLLLTVTALLLSLAFSIPVGVLAAVRRNSLFDQVATVSAVAGVAVPTFWLGLMLIVLFAVKFREWGLPALPPGGMYDLRGGGGLLEGSGNRRGGAAREFRDALLTHLAGRARLDGAGHAALDVLADEAGVLDDVGHEAAHRPRRAVARGVPGLGGQTEQLIVQALRLGA